MHWTAAAINFAQKRIESYDSMGRLDKKVCEVSTHCKSRYHGGLTASRSYANI